MKTVATVAVVTWLIWWAADRRVTDREEFTLRLAAKSGDAAAYAAIEAPRPAEVLATISGTRGRLDAFRAQLQRNPGRVFEYVLPAGDVAPGPRTLSTAKMLTDSKPIRDSGLDVLAVRPAEARVVVDAYEDVRVRIVPDFGTVSVDAVVCQPEHVDVRRITATLARTRLADRILRPAAESAIRQWIASHPDEAEFELELTLSIPDAPQLVEFSPSATVRVAGRFVDLFSTARKGPVQVVFAVPPDVQRQYVVKPTEASNLRPDIYVRGPKADIEQLAPQQVFVYVEVQAADAAGSVRTIRRAPKVMLPPGIELDSDPQEIEFELVERGAGTEKVGP